MTFIQLSYHKELSQRVAHREEGFPHCDFDNTASLLVPLHTVEDLTLKQRRPGGRNYE